MLNELDGTSLGVDRVGRGLLNLEVDQRRDGAIRVSFVNELALMREMGRSEKERERGKE